MANHPIGIGLGLLLLGAAAAAAAEPPATAAPGASPAESVPAAPPGAPAPPEAPTGVDVPEVPTFAEHVAPTVFERCASCHRPGEVAPFPLLDYGDVRKRGRMIARVVEKRIMPPWLPVKGHGKFEGELRLDPAQIETIRRWVDRGMSEGDPAKTPPLPDFPDGWQLGEPDLVVRMPAAYEVPASGPDLYRNFVVPLDLPEDRWITAIEVRPSARNALHHVLFALDTTGRARELDGRDGEPGFFGMQGAGGVSGSGTSGIGGWAVGGMPRHLPLGLAREVPKGADLILRSHFHPSGKPESEQTTLGLHFAEKPPLRSMVGLQLPPRFGYAAGIDIPPGAASYEIGDSLTLPVDALAVTVGGHAHYLCREMQVVVTFPDGRTESIFYIDDWDFDWQNRYQYETPVELPAGTRVDVRISYDNSADNPNNPHRPPKRVGWGLQSTDEMGSVTLLLVAKREKDTRRLRSRIGEHARRSFLQPSARRSAWTALRSRILMLDQDGDGRIETKEVPDRMRAFARRLDTNGDGVIEPAEIDAAGRRVGAGDSGAGGRKRGEQARPAKPEAGPVARGPALRDLEGAAHHPLDARGAQASVILFVTTDCPIANGYAPAIRAICEDHADDALRFFLVHVDPDVTPARAREHARAYRLPDVPILLDHEHRLVAATGAEITPEAVVVRPGGKVAYQGRIDDQYGDLGRRRPAATRHDLRAALRAVLEGRTPDPARTEPVGCTIPDLP